MNVRGCKETTIREERLACICLLKAIFVHGLWRQQGTVWHKRVISVYWNHFSRAVFLLHSGGSWGQL